jgi:hypothetical protein
VRRVKIADIGRERDALELLTLAIKELAIASSLRLIHGDKTGAQRYLESGGHVRFDDEDEPWLVL